MTRTLSILAVVAAALGTAACGCKQPLDVPELRTMPDFPEITTDGIASDAGAASAEGKANTGGISDIEWIEQEIQIVTPDEIEIAEPEVIPVVPSK